VGLGFVTDLTVVSAPSMPGGASARTRSSRTVNTRSNSALSWCSAGRQLSVHDSVDISILTGLGRQCSNSLHRRRDCRLTRLQEAGMPRPDRPALVLSRCLYESMTFHPGVPPSTKVAVVLLQSGMCVMHCEQAAKGPRGRTTTSCAPRRLPRSCPCPSPWPARRSAPTTTRPAARPPLVQIPQMPQPPAPRRRRRSMRRARPRLRRLRKDMHAPAGPRYCSTAHMGTVHHGLRTPNDAL